ncbi:MAG: hypothetical protein WBM76_09060 [Woeseiaceae bacterium]
MKKIFLMATSALLLSACVGKPSLNPALTNCEPQPKWFCWSSAANRTVNINTQRKKLKASPYCIKAKKGTQIVFTLTPPGNAALGTVELIPKDTDPSHSWLAASNSTDQDFIYVDVPPVLDETEKYLYGIKFGNKCTDPRVDVKN